MTATEVSTTTEDKATSSPMLVLKEQANTDALLLSIDAKVAAHYKRKLNVETAKDRDAIISFAFDVTRTKTAIDKAALKLRKEVQDRREMIVAKLDQIAKEVREPVTIWEEKEKRAAAEEAARVAAVNAIMQSIRDLNALPFGITSEDVASRRRKLHAMEFDAALFKDALEEAESLRETVLVFFDEAIERIEKDEEDAAELARLKAIEAKRIADEQKLADDKAADDAAKLGATKLPDAQDAAFDALLVRDDKVFQALADEDADDGHAPDDADFSDPDDDEAEIDYAATSADVAADAAASAATVALVEAMVEDESQTLETIDTLVILFDVNETFALQVVSAIKDGKVPHLKFIVD